MQKINEVLTRMDEIVNECRIKKSRIGYFAILYRQVTRRIKEGIFNGEFEDNARMEKLDVLFAPRFIDAYDLWVAGRAPSKSWFVAFEASEKNSHLLMQHLFLGINAHINLALGISAFETIVGKNISVIEGDFNKINAVLAELMEGVKSNISKVSPIFGWLINWILSKGKR